MTSLIRPVMPSALPAAPAGRSASGQAMPAPRRLVGALAAFLFAAFAGAVPAADIVVDDAAIEPLPGRDYSMRLDFAAARFERIDTQTGETHASVFSTECAATLAPGLWLAVPVQAGLDLLPLGATRDDATRVAAGCRTTPDQAATLPPALLQQIAASGGGVVYVDAAGLESNARVAASGAR